jgi:hypothetical protein
LFSALEMTFITGNLLKKFWSGEHSFIFNISCKSWVRSRASNGGRFITKYNKTIPQDHKSQLFLENVKTKKCQKKKKKGIK